jgi:hypothetical protein
VVLGHNVDAIDDHAHEDTYQRMDERVHPESSARSRHHVPGEPPSVWRAEAERLRHYGAIGNATTLEAAAEQLDSALRADANVHLTIARAAAESGYSADHLERLLRDGRLPNVGRKHAPRVRRVDLPRKPNATSTGLTVHRPEAISKAQIARALIDPPQEDDR